MFIHLHCYQIPKTSRWSVQAKTKLIRHNQLYSGRYMSKLWRCLPAYICQAKRWKLDCLPQISSVERMESHAVRQNAAVFYLFPLITHNKQHLNKDLNQKNCFTKLYPNLTGPDMYIILSVWVLRLQQTG